MQVDQHFILSLLHLLIIGPFLLFVGFQRAATPDWVFQSMFVVGAIVLFYHSFRLLGRLKHHVSYAWVNAMHVLLIAPLLLYIGYHKKETPRMFYELLLMLAFALMGYHVFSLVRMMEVHPEPGTHLSKN